jgi:hypothetical protein
MQRPPMGEMLVGENAGLGLKLVFSPVLSIELEVYFLVKRSPDNRAAKTFTFF